MAAAAASANHSAVCECCSLEYPRDQAMTWGERKLARRLKVLDPAPAENAEDSWESGPYRYYYVDHRHRVCPSCHAYLGAGGAFRGVRRNKAKLAFLVLMAIVALLIAAMPVLLPHLISALWLLPGEGGR